MIADCLKVGLLSILALLERKKTIKRHNIMKKFLINTPLKISWKANIGTLTKSDLSLSLENPTVIIPIDDFELDDDKIVFNFGVEDQKYGGKYDAVLRDSSGNLIDVAAALDIIPNRANNTFGQNGIISVEPDYGGDSPQPGPTPTGLKVIVSTADWRDYEDNTVTANTRAEAAQLAGISEDDLDYLLDPDEQGPIIMMYGFGSPVADLLPGLVQKTFDRDGGATKVTIYASYLGWPAAMIGEYLGGYQIGLAEP